jgi:hypothetical protein
MEKIKTYCSNCRKETIHVIWTEDGYGAYGVCRVISSILSLGMSNLYCDTICKCLSCNRKRIIK